MLTLENEYYTRLILLTLRGGALVLRKTFTNKLTDCNIQLHGFLQINKDTIGKLKYSNALTSKQYNILFPNNDTMPDIDKLDISLLSCLLLNLFVSSMSKSDVKAIENIRTLRNEFLAHHPDGCIDARTFFRKWNQLSTSIMNLGKGLSSENSSALGEIIKSVGDDPIDIKRTIQEIKDESGTMDQFIEHVSQQLDRLSIAVQVIVGEVTVSGRNPEAVTTAAATLIAHAKRSKGVIERFSSALSSSRQGMRNIISSAFARVTGFFSRQNLALTLGEESASQRGVSSLVQDIQDAGGEVIDVKEGSLLLHIRCNSVVVLISMLDYFESTVIKQRLKDLEECLTEETGSKIFLSACIRLESLQDAFQNIQEKQSEMSTKTVRFSVKCRDAQAVLNIVSLFEGSEMSDNISTLSDSLSDLVGGPVSLRTSVDSYTIQEFITRTRDEASTENVIEKREKEEESKKALQNISKEKSYLSTPAELDLSSLAEKCSYMLSHECSYEDGIRLLRKGENQFEFAAFLLRSDENDFVSKFVIDRLNTALHVLTGIKRDLIYTAYEQYRYCRVRSSFFSEYNRPLHKCAIVIAIVSDFNDWFHWARIKEADTLGKQIVLITVEGSDIKVPVLKGFSNLSKVRFDLKKEFGEDTFEMALTEFCASIIKLIPSSKMAGNISTLSASLSDKVGRPDSFGTSVYSYTIQENDNRRRMYQIIQAYIKGTREEASEEKVTEKSFSRFKSEKEEESNKARQNIFKEEIDLPSPAKSDLSLLKGKNTLTLLPERSYNDGIRLLQKGENQFEFAAFLLHSDEDVYLIDLIIDKLNTALHVMTGIDRDLICTEDDKYDDPWSYVSEKYMRYFERSAIVVSIVSDLNDVFHRSLTEVADALGKQIVLINVKGSDIKEPILKEFSNLSKVRFDFKKEFVQGTFETAWREFCTTIIQLVSNSGTRPMSYDGRNRSKSRDISRWGIQIYISHLTCSLPEHYITRLKREENTEFVACLLYGDDVEDEAFVRDIVLHKFNKILQRLTGVDRKLICSCAQSQLHWYDSEYERYMDRSSVVIVFLSKLFREDCLDWQLLQPRRRPEKKVVPMFFEAEEKYATPVIMGIHNLSEVRIVWKVENGQYVLKSSWLHVCNEILEHAAVFTLEQEMH